MTGENWVLLAAIVAYVVVTLTRLALAHRRAQAKLKENPK